MSSPMITTIADLPPEVLVKILEYVRFSDIEKNCMNVCKLWETLIASHFLVPKLKVFGLLDLELKKHLLSNGWIDKNGSLEAKNLNPEFIAETWKKFKPYRTKILIAGGIAMENNDDKKWKSGELIDLLDPSQSSFMTDIVSCDFPYYPYGYHVNIPDEPKMIHAHCSYAYGKMVIGGKVMIVVAGGIGYDGNRSGLDSVELLDPLSDEGWVEGPKLPFKLDSASMVTSPCGKGVIVFGGAKEKFERHSKPLWCSALTGSECILEMRGNSIETLQWKVLDQKLRFPRWNHIAMKIPDEKNILEFLEQKKLVHNPKKEEILAAFEKFKLK